jgi:hypothetical protein
MKQYSTPALRGTGLAKVNVVADEASSETFTSAAALYALAKMDNHFQ